MRPGCREDQGPFGRIDILVNVAGGSGPIGKTGVETTPEEFDDIVTLNMNGCFHTMRGVLPTMMAQRYGKIVNVGGTFGMRGRAGRMAYSASKWGLRGITKSFALEVGAYNINVNCVAPGMVDGPRFRDKVCADMAKKLGITVEQAAERHAADYALKRVTNDAARPTVHRRRGTTGTPAVRHSAKAACSSSAAESAVMLIARPPSLRITKMSRLPDAALE